MNTESLRFATLSSARGTLGPLTLRSCNCVSGDTEGLGRVSPSIHVSTLSKKCMLVGEQRPSLRSRL